MMSILIDKLFNKPIFEPSNFDFKAFLSFQVVKPTNTYNGFVRWIKNRGSIEMYLLLPIFLQLGS